MWLRFLGIVALTTAAGCASGARPVAVDPSSAGNGSGPASPPTVQGQTLDCRGRGVYNRAADLCVSEGS
jgi:hypothetical protein